MQRRVGKRAKLETIGRRVLRPYLTEQHREFFLGLPFVVVGSVDADGRPWASLLAGTPGFAHSPTPERLELRARPLPGDPLWASWKRGMRLGVLGIELPTRRRNRANVAVRTASEEGLVVEVLQSLGQCPKYIRPRPATELLSTLGTEGAELTQLDEAAQEWISRADTFFVASYVPLAGALPRDNVDVSHRGGEPGFLRVTARTLVVPDYAGNSFYNTLGNFLIAPRAGLWIPDVQGRGFLQLTGDVELLPPGAPELTQMPGAERGWRFTLRSGRRILRS